MKNIALYLVLIISALGFLNACSKDSKTRVELGNELGILHVGNGDEPSDVDPHITTGVPESHIQFAIFEGLVSKDSKTLEITPGVAQSWTVSEDQLEYHFKLNPAAKWSNGDNVVAEDFVWSWERALLPGLGNQYAYSLDVIVNAEAFRKGQLKDFSQVGVKAINEHELVVNLREPTPYFLELLDHHSMYPVHRKTVEKFGKRDERGTKWTRPENIVSNGPFIMKEWIPNSVLSVKKNPLYWNSEVVKLNEIHFYPIQLQTAEERMFRAGQLHIVRQLTSSKVEVYKEKNPEVLRSFLNFSTYFYRLNTTIKPLNDVRVRKALAYTIDRELISTKVMKGGQIPAYNLTPPGTRGYTAEAKLVFDIEKAKQLLAEAGYPNGEGFPSLTLLYNTQEDHRRIAESVQQMWKTHLNINITLENQDWKVFLNSQRTLNYQICRAAWNGDYYDPNTFLDMFVTNGGNNETGWSNARYDELIKLAGQGKTPEERYKHFQEAEALLVDEVPIIPVYNYAWNQLVATSVKGWHNNIMDYWSFKGVSLDPSQPVK